MATGTGNGTRGHDVAPLQAQSERRRNGWRPRFGGVLLARRAGEREALLLGLVCAIDMYTTLWWVATGHAVEANPLLAATLQTHPLAFVLVKCLFCLPALILAPRLARRRPEFTVWLLRAVIAAYIGIYVFAIR